MLEVITGAEYGLVPQWNYYKDGNAWLCKVGYKKRRYSGYRCGTVILKQDFTSLKDTAGLLELDLDKRIKEEFKSKPIGTLFPLAITVTSKEQIKDLLGCD